MKDLILTLLAILVFSVSCEKRGYNETFSKIDLLCDKDPQQAIDKLDSMDYDKLSEHDRHCHDLLTIKARDKAYITHISDSLILDAIDYFSKHKDNKTYPEALYYGGRVYADIGDYPSSIDFFQQVLDIVSDTHDNIRFRTSVLSQTGRLLIELRLYSRAIPYLEDAIETAGKLPDSAYGIAYDHYLLHSAYLALDDLKKARHHISRALEISRSLTAEEQADMGIANAHMMLLEGKIDSALITIRPLVARTGTTSLPYALALASEIYSFAGIPDTAYIYAKRLIGSPGISDRKSGFKILFSDEMRNYVPRDTLLAHIVEYRDVLDDYINNHDKEDALISNTRYNYDRHLKGRIIAERKFLIASIIVVCCIITILLLLLFRFMKRARKSMSRSDMLTDILSRTMANSTAASQSEGEEQQLSDQCADIAESEPRNADEVAAASDSESVNAGLPDRTAAIHKIKESEVYGRLVAKIENNQPITINETILDDVEILINSTYPGFTDKLATIAKKKISTTELRVALLIKCGFTTSRIARLLSKEPNTISSQKKSLAQKLLGVDSKAQALDELIKSL